MDGGSGTDGVSYHGSLEPVTALLFTNTGGRSYDSDTYLRPWRTFPAAAATTIWTATTATIFVNGGAGNDILWGDYGDDWLFGDVGNDEPHGGLGNNHLNGDAGYDLCWTATRLPCEN
jgi:Ca2+-binding RTX toxin-like protein